MSLGDSLLNLEKPQYESAVIQFSKAKSVYQTLQLWDDFLNAGLKEGNVYLKRSFRQTDKANAVFDDCIEQVKEQPPSLNLALHYHRKGVACYHSNDYESAIQNYKKALKLRRSLLDENHLDVYRSLYAIGTAYEFSGNYQESIEYLRGALQVIEYQEDVSRLVSLYHRLSINYREIGDFDQSVQYIQNAIRIVENSLGRNSIELASLIDEKGSVFFDQNLFDEAQSAYQEVIGIYKAINHKVGLANGYNNLASTYFNQEKYQDAIENYKKSLSQNNSIENRDPKHIADNHSNLALTYDEIDKADKAIFHHQKALSIARRVFPNQNDYSNFAYYLNLGDAYSNQKKYHLAQSWFQKALFTLLPDFRDTSIFAHPDLTIQKTIKDKFNLQDILATKAKTFAKMAKGENPELLQQALSTYRLAVNVIDLMRQDHSAEGSKLFWTEETLPVYERAIQVCLDLYALKKDKQFLKEAFDFSEKSKSIVLLEAMRDSEAKNFAGIPDSLVYREKELKKILSNLEADIYFEKLNESSDPQTLEQLENTLFENTQAYNDLVKQLEKEHPDYYRMKYDMTTAKVEEVQTWLRDSQAMVSYFVGDSSFYTFKILKDDIEVFSKKVNELDYWVSTLHKSIYSYFLDPDQTFALYRIKAADLYYAAHELYIQLIRPLGDLPSDLIIVPGGVLGYVPFEALLMEDLEETIVEFKDYAFLIKQHTISYSYSATLLREMLRQKREPKYKKLLAFAPEFKASETRQFSMRNLRNSLSPLKYNLEEAQTIHRLFGGKLLAGKEATMNHFEEEAWKYSLLHFATHGKADDENPHFSFLAFTEKDSADNLLYVRDLYNQELCADMVTLSACETGIGKLYRGEGIASLARGFSYAGARSIVTTLWAVPDKKMAEIMKLFYQNLKKGKPKDIALREAKLTYLEGLDSHFSHPFFWAATIPIGDMSPIEVERGSNSIWWISAALLGLLAFWFFRFKRGS